MYLVSSTVGFMWIFGFVTEPFFKKELSFKILLLIGAFSSVISSYMLKKWKANIFTKNKSSQKSLDKHYVVAILTSYLMLIPVVAFIVLTLLLSIGEFSENEALQFLVLISFWLPIWLCVPFGLCLGWWKYNK